jgi:hypothetical protein
MRVYSSVPVHFYTALWHKYRPVLLQLMIASTEGPKQYKLYSHEFKALNPKEKGYTFALHAFQGKALNNIKNYPVAHDLLFVLEESKKASELMQSSVYEFTLDKHFVLHISKVAAPIKVEEFALSNE